MYGAGCSHVLVPVGQTGCNVNKEEHQVGLFGGYNHLLAYFFFKDVIRLYHPSSGVDNGKLLSVPLALAVLTVACGAGGVADDSTTRLCESVKKRRLTYIRASYYCY